MLRASIQQLSSENIQECLEAIQDIGEMARDGNKVDAAIPILLKHLHHTNSSIRAAALWALGCSSDTDVIENIKIVLLQEERRSAETKDWDVINAARTALTRLDKVRLEKTRQDKIMDTHQSSQPEKPFNWGSLIVAVFSVGILLALIIAILTWSASQLPLVATVFVLIIALAFTLILFLIILRLMGLISDKQTISFMNRMSDRIPLLSDLAKITLHFPTLGKPDKLKPTVPPIDSDPEK